MPRFRDRRDAGRRLAEALEDVRGEDPVVLGVPRGGAVVADEIATVLGAPLDVVVVRKLGYPGHEEAGFGALGEDDVVVPETLVEHVPDGDGLNALRSVIEQKRVEVAEQVERYRGNRTPVPIEGTTALVVDDGIATGYTFAAALAIARKRRPRRLLAAVPVASWEGARLVSGYCDEVLAIGRADPGLFFAVSLYYDDFPQISDEQVVELLRRNASKMGSDGSA
jgi:putative phosphoribosyl transferase